MLVSMKQNDTHDELPKSLRDLNSLLFGSVM